MEKRRLDSRDQISFLISTFYKKVRADDLIGSIFNEQIEDWERHISLLTDFWETNLLFVRNYKGNPLAKHIEVDVNSGEKISQEHFGRWLHLWFTTINTFFEGEHAQLAKIRAKNMSTHLFLKMFSNRKQNQR